MSPKLLEQKENDLLVGSLQAVNPKANVHSALAQVAAALERHQDRPRFPDLQLQEDQDALWKVRRLASGLNRRVQHASPQLEAVIARGLRRTKAKDVDGFIDILSHFAAACVIEIGKLIRQVPQGRPQSGRHLRPLILELLKIFEAETGEAMRVSKKRTYSDPGPGWLVVTKDTAARRFVEVTLLEVLDEELAEAEMRTVLLWAQRTLHPRSAKPKKT